MVVKLFCRLAVHPFGYYHSDTADQILVSVHETALMRCRYSLQVFNNAADFSNHDESSAISNVETDADESRESNLSTQKPPNGSSQSTETACNEEVLNYSADSFNSLYLDTRGIPDKVQKWTLLPVSMICYSFGT